jgi:uncharacterized protein (TIGR02246 family)
MGSPGSTRDPADDAAIRSIPEQMADAWNRGNGDGFAARFADDADFVAFEGTHLLGRRQIALFHQHVFDTVAKGSRITAEVKFVHFLAPEAAAMHSIVRVTLRGETEPFPGRDSMQMFVVAKRTGRWVVEAALNARKVTPERQGVLDELDALPREAQRRVGDVVLSLRRALR